MVISSTELVMLGTLIPFFPSLITSISSMGLIASVLKIHSKSDHFSLPLNLPILLVTVTCLFFTLYRECFSYWNHNMSTLFSHYPKSSKTRCDQTTASSFHFIRINLFTHSGLATPVFLQFLEHCRFISNRALA